MAGSSLLIILTTVSITLLAAAFLPLSTAQDSPQSYLRPHNRARSAVRVGPLKWDKKLAKFARDHANKCEFKHSGGRYGENLAMGWPEISVAKSVQLWVDEKKWYNCPANQCQQTQAACSHYTQVVWSDTKRLGCARVKCNKGGRRSTLVVCSYDPTGNVVGRRPYKCRNSLADSLQQFLRQYI